ncbi:MAG: 4Fe-4S dicluster domain-containing protein [Candidatus Omnitrophota bacterium]
MKISRKEAQSKFIVKIEELSGENIYKCYQCGKCSAGCPIVGHMDILPNQIIRLIQLGSEKEVLDSKTIWLCSSCLQCAAKCPKGVDVAKIMDTLREVLKREGVDKVELKKIAEKMWKKLPQQLIVCRFRKSSD